MQYELPGLAGSVPRIQIVTIEQAMELRDRAVRLPALRQDSFKRGAGGGWRQAGRAGVLRLALPLA
jgi:hypothetical protein